MFDHKPQMQATSSHPITNSGFKLFTDSISNHMTIATLIAVDMTEASIHVHPAKDFTAPVLETLSGAKIDMPFAIVSFFARESGNTNLLGKTPFQQSEVEQYAAFAASTIRPAVHYVEGACFGTSAHIDKHHALRVIEQLYTDVKTIDNALAGKKYLVGETLNLAEIIVLCSLLSAF